MQNGSGPQWNLFNKSTQRIRIVAFKSVQIRAIQKLCALGIQLFAASGSSFGVVMDSCHQSLKEFRYNSVECNLQRLKHQRTATFHV